MHAKSKLSVLVLSTSFLAGCFGASTEDQLAKAINETIGRKTCFSLKEKKVPQWPLVVRRAEGMFSEQGLDPILADMQAAGYLQITQEKRQEGMFPVTVDVIAPDEKAKQWWDPQEGFCVGTLAVAEIKDWTEPGKDSGVPTQVQYTWHLEDVPGWARTKEFNNIPGMAAPVDGVAVVQKTNKGWTTISDTTAAATALKHLGALFAQ